MLPCSIPRTIGTGLSGLTGASFAIITPFQEHLEWGVRFGASVVGLVVACLSATLLTLQIRKILAEDRGQMDEVQATRKQSTDNNETK